MQPLKILVVGVLLVGLCSFPVKADSLRMVDAQGKLLKNIAVLSSSSSPLLDLRSFFRALDFSVAWDRLLERLEVKQDDLEMRFQPGTRRVLLRDRLVAMGSSPSLRQGRLYLSVKEIVALLNQHTPNSLLWNASRQQIQLAESEAWSVQDEPDPLGRFLPEEKEQETPWDELLVILDPGHGGRDPGAIGANGLQEKKVVLDMALTIKKYLEEHYPKIKPKLTRTDDRFLPLEYRTQIANELEADVFISIHANSGRSSYASGFEVFTLSGDASDPSSSDLAKIENSALRYEGYDREEIDDLTWILWQLQNTVHTRESKRLARVLLKKMDENLPSAPNRGMKQAPFWVLKDAQMPAILVESGFLSNPTEERKLLSEEFHRALARALADALEQFRSSRS